MLPESRREREELLMNPEALSFHVASTIEAPSAVRLQWLTERVTERRLESILSLLRKRKLAMAAGNATVIPTLTLNQ